MATVDLNAVREQKTRQGMFFISLGVGATAVVVGMLLFVLGYMLYRGSARLFYSPTFVLYHSDGSVSKTVINQNVDFDAVDELGKIESQSPLQAAKHFRNAQILNLTFGGSPVPDGTVVEVWKDEIKEVADPWEDDPAAPKIKKMVSEKKEEFNNASDFSFNPDKSVFAVKFKDGTAREFDKSITLNFRQGNNLINRRTLVTRYLQDNPDEAKKRKKAADALMASTSREGALAVDPRWKVWLKDHVKKGEGPHAYLAEERVKEFAPVVAFTVIDQWNWFQFFWDFPRSGNTEGGVLPCIYGTVMMTLIMTLIVAPFGIATAVYLREYAHDTWFTHLIRLAVANLAGVPSIVFGLFGLGFFVLYVGGSVDGMFYGGEKVFGTPCVLWAGLTMALLTLPVMIVASEEALRTVPKELREGAMALGATKFATIMTVVLPTALPGILTGVILAVARGAGEVAPLLLTGVVAHKDQLPTSPLEKFMDLAYHIYDLSVKSQPNKIEEAQSLAFSAALVLVMVVLAMNLLAILLRARLGRSRSA